MTKYRIRLKNGRVIGPFVLNQLHELKTKGHIQGTEEAQIFPTGAWSPISSFDFYPELMDQNKTEMISTQTPKEETFIIDLTKLRAQKNELEIDKIDVTHHDTVQELTSTVRISAEVEKKSPELKIENEDEKLNPELQALVDIEYEDLSAIGSSDKTLINPIAQQEIEKMRRTKAAEEERENREKEEKLAYEVALAQEEEEQKLIEVDESTQMIRLDQIKGDLIQDAEVEELRIEKESKAIKKKQKQAEAELNQDDEETPASGNKRAKFLTYAIVIGALLYAFLFPNGDEKNEKIPFKHIEPIVEFPVPFDKADTSRSEIEYKKALALFQAGDYPSLIKAGVLLKSSYENNMESEEALNLLVRDYAEQLRYSHEDKLGNAQIVFNLIQAKRVNLMRHPNGVIGLNLFYTSINKLDAAADVMARYLKLSDKTVTQDLFATYLQTLIKVGKLEQAKQFLQPLLKAPEKNHYTYHALIDYYQLNQETDKALEYTEEAIKRFPHLVGFYLKKADFMIKVNKFKEADELLAKSEELNLENNDINRARFLELKGLILAKKGDVKSATKYFTKSLAIEDSDELRLRLSELSVSNDPTSEADKLIAESKAVKLLSQAKTFLEQHNYELALSSAARASDTSPGHIPSELFLAKMQLKLGLAKQGLKTLEDLIKKYPDDRSINLAIIDGYIDTYKFNDARQRIGIISGTDLKYSYEFASANGRLYIKMGDSLQAISWLRNSININPLNDRDIFLLAELLIKRANFDAARLLLNKCMELDPINPDYIIAYSKILYEQQDDQAAIGYLLSLADQFGENPKVLSEIAIFYYRAGKVKDFQAYKEKLEKLPNPDKSLYEFLIKAAMLDERYDEIPALVEKLLVIEPGDIEAMMTAGRVLFESGKIVESAYWFKRVQEKLETYPKVQYYIAKIKYLGKDYDGAIKDIEADIKANGDNDADLTLLGQLWVEKGDLIQAENYFKKSQKLNPKGFDSLMGLADLSTKRNNFDLALDLYRKALSQKGDEAIIHKKIGDVYRLLGQGGLAVESYKLYLDMNPEASDKSQIQSYINLMQ